jgi:hypothetical protein
MLFFFVTSCYHNLKLERTGRKDCVRLIASSRALNSYVIKFIIKLKMAYILGILPIIQFRMLCRSDFYLNT